MLAVAQREGGRKREPMEVYSPLLAKAAAGVSRKGASRVLPTPRQLETEDGYQVDVDASALQESREEQRLLTKQIRLYHND